MISPARERLPPKLENMIFEILCYLWLMALDFRNFGQHVFFGYMSNIFVWR
jgi:hypothetical protein